MTHTLHQQGDLESLKREYIVLHMGGPRHIRIFRTVLAKKFPSVYSVVVRFITRLGIRRILRPAKNFESKRARGNVAVLHSKHELYHYLKKVKEANTGESIVVSGVFEEVNACLKELGLCFHTVQFSLGYFGKTELLPRTESLSVTTMCGHHLVSPDLVETLVSDVKRGTTTPERAAQDMSKLCKCGIFNEARAAQIIRVLVK